MEPIMQNTPRLCLSFVQGEHAYLVDIQQVRETVGLRQFSPSPGAASGIVGIVHRGDGTPVPVVELGSPRKPLSVRAARRRSIVILNAGLAGGRREVGVMVDTFPDIVDLGESASAVSLLDPAQLLPADDSLPATMLC